MTKRGAAALLILLLAVPPLLDALGADIGPIRFAGLSLLWWYAGVTVPALGVLVAVAARSAGATPGLLAAWLTPVAWLAMAALIVERGPEGLWMSLVLALAPLVALGVRPRGAVPPDAEPVFPVVALLLVVGMLVWACLALAGDAAATLGVPRWQGVAVAAAAAWLLTAWPGPRMAPALWLIAWLAVAIPLAGLAVRVGLGPIDAWTRVATLTAFRFPAPGPRTTPPGAATQRTDAAELTVAEEQRTGGAIAVRDADSGVRAHAPADARVPGAPPTGIAWAAGQRLEPARAAGWMVTALFGALGLLGVGAPAAGSRSGAAALAAGALVLLLWAQGWAVYWLAAAPDVFAGGLTPERLLALPAVLDGHPASPAFEAALLGGMLIAFLASSVALRQRLGALDRRAGGDLGRDLGLWTGVLAVAALASLWPLDPWALTRLALGAAASGLGPVALAGSSPARARAAAVAGAVGLALFGAVAVAGMFPLRAGGIPDEVWAHPALVAVPAGLLVGLLLRFASRR